MFLVDRSICIPGTQVWMGKDETIDLYQIAIFIKQIAFASMDAGVSKEIK